MDAQVEQPLLIEKPKEGTLGDDIAKAVATMTRVVRDADADRMRAAARLINTFNYAIQVQAQRVEWSASDFRSFAIALTAIDTIGQTNPTDYE